MTRRCALLRFATGRQPVPPPGIDPQAYADAMFDDVAEVLHGLEAVDTLVVCPPGAAPAVRSLVWPQVPVVERADRTVAGVAALAVAGEYRQLALVAADAPDLPQLVLAKVFQALSRSPVAVAPAAGDGAVALGLQLPAPAWLPAIGLDSVDVVEVLQAAGRDQVRVTPGWHRLRTPADIGHLDPGLDGWEATRALLAGVSPRSGA